MSNTGAALAAEYEQARDAVIDAQAALEAAERRLAVAADKMLGYIDARRRHPCTAGKNFPVKS